MTVHSVLTRHFLRRFLENDLISPETDRSQTLAVLGAALFSTSVFITVTLSCLKYVMSPYTPGEAAVSSLDDKFFYIATSMIVVALLAVLQWDALVVDARDAAILEPLPVRAVAMRRAKLASVVVFGATATTILNVAPTVVFPLLVTIKLPPDVPGAARLLVTHALVTVLAAAFGYLLVIAVRETLSLVLGPRVFARVSPWVQGVLVVLLGSTLLLVPPMAYHVERNGLGTIATYSPPTWFLGLYETLAGDVIADARRVTGVAAIARRDASFTAAYRRHVAQFAELRRNALAALALISLIAALGYVWNARRARGLAIPPAAPWHQHAVATRLARLLLIRDSTACAGFCFTLAVMWRSGTHRLTLACAGAAGVALSIVALTGVDLQTAAATGRLFPRLLVVQPFIVGAVLVAFRHAIRVPAELRANWGLQLAWRERRRQFVAGVRLAVIAGLVIPALITTMPLIAFVLGPRIALLHAAIGLAGGIVLLDALLVTYRNVPFTCSYVPNENMKALGPIYVLVFTFAAISFARIEAAVLAGRGVLILVVLFAVILAALRGVSHRGTRTAVVFDERPAALQRLGLHT